MNTPGMRVRCLASTKAPEQSVQEDGLDKQDEQKAQTGSIDVDGEEKGLGIHEYRSKQHKEAGPEANDDEINRKSPSSTRSTSSSRSDTEVSSDETSSGSSPLNGDSSHTSCIQESQLSPDGTCIFTSDYSRTFSVYPIDTTILSGSGRRKLTPYAKSSSPNPIWAFAINPLFNLQDANSTQVLVSRRDSYITLHNALWDTTHTYDAASSTSLRDGPVDISKPLMSYKLIDHLTEAVTAPISLAYSHDGTHFFAGKQNGIATFNLEYADDPVHTISTIPAKRNKLKGGGRGFKGWISALSLSPPSVSNNGGLLAAGARTRYVGIYDSVSGGEVTQFSLPGTIDGKKFRNENLRHIMGDGVSYLKWSPCGKYLYVAERQSDALLIYDVRQFSLSLGYCIGRKALTKQKIGFDVWNAGASPYDIEGISHEVWAGGTDGKVRVWRDPYMKEGAVEADEVVRVGDEEVPVVGTLVHPSGSLAVTASGVVEIGDEMTSGMIRGGGIRPKYKEWGRLDIFGLE